jgi:hypothetical protein
MPRRVFHPLVVLSVFISGLALTIIQPKSALAASADAPSLLISQRAPGERPLLMVVGVAHFDNPARDVVNTKVDNVLTPKRQKEILAVVDQLAKFHPNHVAVEWAGDQAGKARRPLRRLSRWDLRTHQRREGPARTSAGG